MSVVLEFFQCNPTSAIAQNTELWITEDLKANLDDITDFNVKRDTAKVLRDDNGNKPIEGGYEWFTSLETCKLIITMKDGSKHSIRCISNTGVLISLITEEDDQCQ